MSGWDDMLAEFRALGGTAENICRREGVFGRGLFPVEQGEPIAIRIPESLLLATDDARFDGGLFRVAPEARIGARERAFLERYENEFSWGDGGRAETARIFAEANALPADLRRRLRDDFHCGDWFSDATDARVAERFVGARCITYRARPVVMPIVELANHGAGPAISTRDGVALQGRFDGEIFAKYSDIDAHGTFATWGFAVEQPQAFSIALGGSVGGRQLHIGRDLGNLAPDAVFWTPRYSVKDGNAKLEYLTLGSRHRPQLCRSTFCALMREMGFRDAEQGFETIQHANRMHFLALAGAVEGAPGPMALTLRRVARYQLQALSFCYGAAK
jgi:hypothetical protein